MLVATTARNEVAGWKSAWACAKRNSHEKTVVLVCYEFTPDIRLQRLYDKRISTTRAVWVKFFFTKNDDVSCRYVRLLWCIFFLWTLGRSYAYTLKMWATFSQSKASFCPLKCKRDTFLQKYWLKMKNTEVLWQKIFLQKQTLCFHSLLCHDAELYILAVSLCSKLLCCETKPSYFSNSVVFLFRRYPYEACVIRWIIKICL